MSDWPWISERETIAARGLKNQVDPHRPYAWLVEPELQPTGQLADVATLFLTNRECPFKCLFCDLWRNTLDEVVPRGAIPEQIRFALEQIPPARVIKLYNSGNFFDPQAIPPEDLPAIADLVRPFERVIVENHPRLCRDEVRRFQELLGDPLQGGPQLEVAIGLETIHPLLVTRLNKRMPLAEFEQAVRRLLSWGIDVRTFILIRPPYLSVEEGELWATRALEYAWNLGIRCCSLIPVRAGNGILDQLQQQGHFTPPPLSSLEAVLEFGLQARQGRVFVDLWDAEKFATCPKCATSRIERLQRMNLSQQLEPAVTCDCNRQPSLGR